MSARVFRRGLSDGLFRDLLDGPCATVRRACLAARLDARLRPDAISFYSHGRSLALIRAVAAVRRGSRSTTSTWRTTG